MIGLEWKHDSRSSSLRTMNYQKSVASLTRIKAASVAVPEKKYYSACIIRGIAVVSATFKFIGKIIWSENLIYDVL